MTPAVSVIIPCYNQAHFLGEAIESCLAQNWPHMQIIVVDDGSTDATPDICARYAREITCIRQPNSGLPAVARNTGLEIATGKYIQFLDADDRILPGKFEEQVETLEAEPAVGVVYSDGYLIDQAGQRIGPAKINHPSGWVFHELLTMWGTQVAAVLVRKECLDKVGPFNTDDAIRGCEDLEMWLRLAARYEFRARPEFRFEYRVGAASVSSNPLMMLRSGLNVLRRNSRVHANCKECRRAIKKGRRRWKDVAAFGMMSQARDFARHGRWKQALDRLGQTAYHHPRHLLHVANPRHLGSKLSALRRLPKNR